jgi:hypothetical protein
LLGAQPWVEAGEASNPAYVDPVLSKTHNVSSGPVSRLPLPVNPPPMTSTVRPRHRTTAEWHTVTMAPSGRS